MLKILKIWHHWNGDEATANPSSFKNYEKEGIVFEVDASVLTQLNLHLYANANCCLSRYLPHKGDECVLHNVNATLDYLGWNQQTGKMFEELFCFCGETKMNVVNKPVQNHLLTTWTHKWDVILPLKLQGWFWFDLLCFPCYFSLNCVILLENQMMEWWERG